MPACLCSPLELVAGERRQVCGVLRDTRVGARCREGSGNAFCSAPASARLVRGVFSRGVALRPRSRGAVCY